MRRTLIPPSLRPQVTGSHVSFCPPQQEREDTCEASHIPLLVVIASSTDATASYFYEGCLLEGTKKWRCNIDSYDVYELIKLLPSWQVSSSPPALYVRLPSTSDNVLAQLYEYLNDFVHLYHGRVISGSGRNHTNYSKPLQTSRLWAVQPSLVKGMYSRILRVPLSSTRPLICKSISGERSVVRAITATTCTAAEDLFACPSYYQHLVSGTHYRLHVCDETVVTAQIISSCLDYREDSNLKINVTEIPQSIAEWAVSITRDEGLVFSGIDLLYDPLLREYLCFELNPAPGYHFFERMFSTSDLSITRALEAYLLS
jgi:hypothetical protein